MKNLFRVNKSGEKQKITIPHVRFFASLIFLTMIVYACSKKSDPVQPKISLTGTVKNSTNIVVKNANVTVSLKGSTVATTTTDATGKFTASNLAAGDYVVNISSTGYTTQNQNITLTTTNTSPTVDYTLLGGATISGTIIDSQTGSGLSATRVSFYFRNSSGTDTTAANANLVATTTSTGGYSITDAPTGTFVVVIRTTGYTVRVIDNVNITSSTNNQTNVVQVKSLTSGLRIILTWGQTPSDLDSHVTGPISGSSSRFHMYYSNKTPSGSTASLDVDDVSSFGPETTTITSFTPGTYRYSVFNYSQSGSTGASGIQSSPTRVEVYSPAGLIRTFTAPTATSGNTWTVFEIVATSSTAYTINDVNTYKSVTSDSNTANFRVGEKTATYDIYQF
ncbi:MAG: carboxypeptidase regulatory-like domain-containing protein [Limisphaerales bacterium]